MRRFPRAPGTPLSPMVSAIAAVLVAAQGCTGAGPTPKILSVTPAVAYSDTAVTLVIEAPGIRLSLLVDVDSRSATFERSSARVTLIPSAADGRAPVPLDMNVWKESSLFLAAVPAHIAPGFYDVKLTGPDGKSDVSPGAFLSAGPKTEPPLITITSPTVGQKVASAQVAPASFVVDDDYGQLMEVSWRTWNDVSEIAAGTCDLVKDPLTQAGPSTFSTASGTACPGLFGPPSPDSFTTAITNFVFSVTAIDIGGLTTTVDVPVVAAQKPMIISIDDSVGRLAGGQPFKVIGKFLPDDAKVSIGAVNILDPMTGLETGGVWKDDTTIVGLTPPNGRAETRKVTVKTTWGEVVTSGVDFRYALPPTVRIVQPVSGPSSGGTKMTIAGNDLRKSVKIKFGATLDTAKELLPLFNYTFDMKVTGTLPPGHGTVSVWAVDAVTGEGHLADAFTYIEDAPVEGATAGAGVASASAGSVAGAAESGSP